MTILSIGRTTYDISCPVEDYPIEGAKYLLNEKIESGGGCAANVAYLLGKWGEDSYFAGVVGSDDYGSKIKKELEQATVKTTLMETSYEVGTSLSIILVNKKSSTRTRFDVVGGAQPNLKKFEYAIGPQVIFADGREYQATINAVNKYKSAISIVSASYVDRDMLELCKYMKYIVCSKAFAETVTGLKIDFDNSGTLVNVYKKLKERYPNNEIVVTLENMGAMYTVNGEIRIMPGIEATVVDPSCAGDIFDGAFCYCLANNFDIEKAITYSNIAAGLSITKMGGRVSIPSIKEVIAYYHKKFHISEDAPIEEKKEEIKAEEVLPDIPDAKTFKIPDPNEALMGGFSIGGNTFGMPNPNANINNVTPPSVPEEVPIKQEMAIPVITPDDANVQQ